MLDSIFAVAGSVSFTELLICTAASLVLGIAIALVYMYKNTYSKTFVLTVALMPALVQAVIMMVNGNLGTGVAIMGAFGLVRFRSVPGSARDISTIFFSMAVGLATGMGFIAYGVLFTVVVGAAMIVFMSFKFAEKDSRMRTLEVTIPEDLDYDGLFDDVFKSFTKSYKLDRVKTASLGSLFELRYSITMRGDVSEKEMLDQIRMRNGNLKISCGKAVPVRDEL